ncbi:hypothetical protein HHI36_020230 [Cryptolaemus montrouzieri]|uniref:Dual oxidase maturation factor 1 n=1 Tax=Cryptolaemus montrouzieri TaxID=559131 RepID=A0ABD2NAE5_9CUCU
MRGWFDAFRNDGGPTLYNFNNRTAVTGDVTIITFLTIFTTLYIAFLIIFPGVRKEKFTTFFTVTLSLFVGATILVSIFGSSWHIAHTAIFSTYKAFSKEKIAANLGVYVGLAHVNITLQALPVNNRTPDIDFNERFTWIDSSQMGDSFKEAIARGLPFPILTVAEYFTLGQDGLSWGSQYRSAGYYAIIMLWTSFAVWVLMNLMLIVVPRYGALLMTTCGFLLLATCCGYFGMLPEIPLTIHTEGKAMQFHFGWCYWLVVTAGGICLLSGVIITTIEIIVPHSFSTILEVDYDTPYDRHIIIEDSHGKRFQRKRNSGNKLDDPAGDGLGFRILKRLSSKTKEEQLNADIINHQIYEMESSKSPWRYSINTISGRPLQHKAAPRSISDDTLSTISGESRIHSDLSRYRINPERAHEVTMW